MVLMKKNLGTIIMFVGFFVAGYGAIKTFPLVFYYMNAAEKAGVYLSFFASLKHVYGVFATLDYLNNYIIIFFFGIFVFIIGLLFKKKGCNFATFFKFINLSGLHSHSLVD